MDDTDNITYYGTADTVLSIIANVMLLMLYLYPVPTLCRMIIKDPEEEYHPYPYVITFANCGLWHMYARLVILEPTTPFYGLCLAYSNNIGFIFSFFYVLIFLAVNDERNKTEINERYFNYGMIVLVPVTITLVTIVLLEQFKFLGPLCVASGVSMYVSPLSISRNVYKTKNIKYLPFWLGMAHCLNGLIWVIYSCVSPVFDLYIAITNGVGMLLGLFQLLKYYRFQNPQNSSKLHPETV